MTDLGLFFIASLALNLTPGNDMLYVISKSVSYGFKAGLYSSIGIFLGCLVHVLAAVLGLSLLIAQSAFLFSLIKFAGAAYLIYLGLKAFTTKAHTIQEMKLQEGNHVDFLKQGIITNALNPKVAIFFLSFLPQFIDAGSGNVQLQLLFLGLWFSMQGTLLLIILSFFIGRTRSLISHYPRFWALQGKVTGVLLIALGIKLAITSRK